MKNSWSKVLLSTGATEIPITNGILNAFPIAFTADRCPPATAVFLTRASDPTSELYFSPAAWTFGQIFGATACEPPEREGLTFVARGPHCTWSNFP